ncbi:MFS transporter [Thermodesulfobacteriota bacterium]
MIEPRQDGPDARGSAIFGKALALPTAIMAVFAVFQSFGHFFLPIYFKEGLGFDGARIGGLFAALSLTSIISAFPIGLSSDRVAPKHLVTASLLMTAAACSAMAAARSFPVFLAVFVVFGISMNMLNIVLNAYLFKTAEAGDRSMKFGIFNAYKMIGFAMGMILGGVFLERLGFPAILLIIAVASTVLILPGLYLPPVSIQASSLRKYGEEILKPEPIYLFLWILLFTTHWGAENVSYSLFLKRELGLSLPQMGLYMTGEFAALVVVLLLLGRHYPKGSGVEALFMAGLVVSGAGHIGMTVHTVPLSFAFRIVHGIGDGVVMMTMFMGIARLFKVERVGGHSSLVLLGTMVGGFVGSLVYGPITETLGYAFPLRASGIVILVLVVVHLFWMRLRRSGETCQ